MGQLSVIFIDVGWGDSVFLEYAPDNGRKRYALVDSNDSSESLSSYTFIKQHFELNNVRYSTASPAFDFVLLTHWHSDHYSGLKKIIRKFGTRYFWYPKSRPEDMAVLLNYANRHNSKIETHEAVNLDKVPPRFGDVTMRFHWPPYTAIGPYDANPNNTSVVLELDYDNVRLLLTGDCQAENWGRITSNTSRSRIKVIQAPHHGAKNGMFVGNQTPWLDFLGRRTKIALSSHIHPHHHPHPDVVTQLENDRWRHFRTDQDYHLCFEIRNRRVYTKWSHY